MSAHSVDTPWASPVLNPEIIERGGSTPPALTIKEQGAYIEENIADTAAKF